MDNSKWVATSLTAWGGLMAALPAVLPMFGVEVGNVEEIGQAGSGAINGAAAVIGFVLVLIGRKKAANDTRQIRMLPKMPQLRKK
jgi:hypothetical protein